MLKAVIFLVFINIKLGNKRKLPTSIHLNIAPYLVILVVKRRRFFLKKNPPLNIVLHSHSFSYKKLGIETYGYLASYIIY